MAIRETQREIVMGRLAAHMLDHGLARTSLRQLAAAAGVSDRMLLYYFADKAEILGAVMERIAGELALRLAQAVPDDQLLSPSELIVRAAAFTTGPEMRRFMRLWVEVVAAASRGEAPFPGIVRQVMAGFRAWVDARLALPEGADREGTAAAIIAIIDGLALVDICSDDDIAPRMAAALPALLGGEHWLDPEGRQSDDQRMPVVPRLMMESLPDETHSGPADGSGPGPCPGPGIDAQ